VRPGRASPTAVRLRRYRDANPEYADRERKRTTARWEALQGLARRHPAEFMKLYEAELAHAGLDAGPPMERPCPCGGVIRRRSPFGRWPSSCDECAPPEALRRRIGGKPAAEGASAA